MQLATMHHAPALAGVVQQQGMSLMKYFANSAVDAACLAIAISAKVGALHSDAIAAANLYDMQQPISGFHQDDEQHWVAELACGHFQHVRHDPPWTLRPWVVTEEGRRAALEQLLNCKKCDAGAPPDRIA